MGKNTVSVIIPVLNEEKTVKGVVKAVLASDLVSEVICVNDGSTDKSLEILKNFGNKIVLIDLKRNHGKGFAMALGVKRAKGEIVAFIDSDHFNLSQEHIRDLLSPLIDDNYQAVVGIASNPKTGRYKFPLDVYISGQRAYLKEILLPHLSRIAKAGYGVEMFLNSLVPRKEKKFVALKGLGHINKEEKWQKSLVFRKKLEAGRDIVREVARKEVFPKKYRQEFDRIARAKTLSNLKNKVAAIKNKSLRKIFKKYILGYVGRDNK